VGLLNFWDFLGPFPGTNDKEDHARRSPSSDEEQDCTSISDAPAWEPSSLERFVTPHRYGLTESGSSAALAAASWERRSHLVLAWEVDRTLPRTVGLGARNLRVREEFTYERIVIERWSCRRTAYFDD